MNRRWLLVFVLIVTLLGSFSFAEPQPAAAQGGVVWTAQFYNNRFLLGTPAATTSYGQLSFDWGAGSPLTDVNADNFSARFATDTYFSAGTYRFYILADDAVQLWIDFPPTQQPSLTSFNEPKPGQMLTVDVTLTAGTHHVQVDFRENEGVAYLYVSWANLATNPSPPAFPAPVSLGGSWTAQYYNNTFLGNAPVVTRNEASPSRDWSTGAPVEGVPADNFSVRWTSVQNLTGGTYRIRVRSDDGVRVYVNGSLVINEFHPSSGQTYESSVTLGTGQHSIVIEYYEAQGFALLDFQMVLPGGGGTVTPPATGTTATVTAWRLNVRSAPNTVTGAIIAKIDRGNTYPVLGSNADGTWYQISVNGLAGWVSGRYVSINQAGSTPPTPAPAPTSPTGYSVTARVNLNIRSGPSIGNTRLTYLPVGQAAPVFGRTADNTWYQVQYNGVTGWLSAYYVDLTPGADITRIPITG